MKTVPVALGSRSYEVRIGRGVIAQAADHLGLLLRRQRVVIVTDENVATTQLPSLQAGLEAAGIAVATLILPAGESTKGWPQFTRTVEWLLDQKVERRDVVIALGGGVIGDLAGFAAAVLRRGVRFVQIPTSLLAMVDSSVGGKTGINTLQGKNLVGAFHQPSLVLADIGALDTLPAREFRSGYGEVVKYGLLGDAAFFEWLEVNGPQIASNDDLALHAVAHAVGMKAAIVARDETEEGERALLNLGHTFCHALEKATGYSDRLLHGEGVAIGCLMAAELSRKLGLLSQEAPSRLGSHLQAMGMKATLADIPGDLPDAAALLGLMGQDKKVVDGKLRFILMNDIGSAFIADDVPAEKVIEVLEGR